MPSGYQVGGVDLDSIFDPLGSANPIADIGMQVEGVDLAQRYYPLEDGGTPVADPTGYQVAGADLNTIFGKAGGGPTTDSWEAINPFGAAPPTITADGNPLVNGTPFLITRLVDFQFQVTYGYVEESSAPPPIDQVGLLAEFSYNPPPSGTSSGFTFGAPTITGPGFGNLTGVSAAPICALESDDPDITGQDIDWTNTFQITITPQFEVDGVPGEQNGTPLVVTIQSHIVVTGNT